MTERLPKGAAAAGIILAGLVLAYAAFSRPWYFTNQSYLGGIVLLELLLAAVWLYRRIYFPVLIVAFLLAGVDLPVGAFWTSARWAFLAIGAFVGFFLMLRQRENRFGFFHAVAMFAVLTALVSAAVSHYPSVVLLKVLSLFLLFLYAGTGGRLAVRGQENRFFGGLILGCEIFIAANAVLYAVGIEAMGNPNSLGAVTGVVCAPILLWAILLGGEPSTVRRRWIVYTACMALAFASHARAGMAAALLSSGLLCLALRKYKLFVEGAIVLIIVFAASGIFRPETITALTSSVVYKGGDQQLGMLASRESPWKAAMDNIHEHPWFGTGLGTTANGTDAEESEHTRISSSSVTVTSENGSSYLAITSGVGILGVLPFGLLLTLLIGKVFRTVAWMRRSGSALHPAIPLAMIMVGGMAHAAFEDWLFAPGYYLCVFFWSAAFILIDVGPSGRVSLLRVRWHPESSPPRVGNVAPIR